MTTPSQPPCSRDWLALAGFIALCGAISIAGAAATSTSVGGWYQTLVKPPLNPPDWVFGPVWTVLYLFIAIAGWRIWRLPASPTRRLALTLYFVQLALNLVWSFLFFGAGLTGLAFADLLVLVVVIAIAITIFQRLDQLAAVLFIPYGLWVTFAAYLNGSIWFLN